MSDIVENGSDRTVENGSEVLIPVPTVKEPEPSLIWKIPSVVRFLGPLPISKSISLAPHCLTYAAIFSRAVEKEFPDSSRGVILKRIWTS